jgi:DNA topoisomerase II
MKLDDANNAGGRKAKDCTLIFTEGDSVKSLAFAGFSEMTMEFFHSEKNY